MTVALLQSKGVAIDFNTPIQNKQWKDKNGDNYYIGQLGGDGKSDGGGRLSGKETDGGVAISEG